MLWGENNYKQYTSFNRDRRYFLKRHFKKIVSVIQSGIVLIAESDEKNVSVIHIPRWGYFLVWVINELKVNLHVVRVVLFENLFEF